MKGPCTESLEFTVGKVYLQVMFGVALMYSCLLILEGKTALMASMICMVLTMTKHITVDGLIPPPPVMALVAMTILAIVVAPAKWGLRAYVFFCLFNAFTFLTNPLMVLQDTFPDITDGSPAYNLGAFSMEVKALYLVMAGVYAACPAKAYGLAFSSQIGSSVLAKHVIIDKSGPPTPMIILFIVTTLLAWYEVGWANFEKKADDAIKKRPMRLHGLVVGTSVVLYFVIEAFGGSMPFVGLKSIDTSYEYTGATAMLTGMLALFLAMSAYTEYTGQMEGKLFAIYHYFLSPIVFFWQVQPTTTMLGVAFFALPHVFTGATIYLLFAKSAKLA